MSEGQTGEEAWLHEKGVSDALVNQYKSKILDFISNKDSHNISSNLNK